MVSDVRVSTLPPPRIADGAIMQPDRVIRIKTEIPHTMSPLCRQIHPLPECEGCTAEKDKKMKGL